jgi:hypothetical protein
MGPTIFTYVIYPSQFKFPHKLPLPATPASWYAHKQPGSKMLHLENGPPTISNNVERQVCLQWNWTVWWKKWIKLQSIAFNSIPNMEGFPPPWVPWMHRSTGTSHLHHIKTNVLAGLLVAQDCNPSYLGGWDPEDHSSRPALANSSPDSISKIIREQNELEVWL